MPVYVELEVIRANLGIAADDDSRDDLLTPAIEAASRSIDTSCGRRFYLDESESARVLSPRGRVVADIDGQRLLVDDIGHADLTVEIGAGDSWSDITSQVEVEPADALGLGRPITSLLHDGRWEAARQRVRVTARWGWPQVPADVTQATLLQAMRLYERRKSPEGVTGSADWGVVRLSRRDPDVWALIEHYVLPGFG